MAAVLRSGFLQQMNVFHSCQLDGACSTRCPASYMRMSLRGGSSSRVRSMPARRPILLLCRSSMDDRVADEEYMKEYDQLKTGILDTSRKSGAAIATYLFLAADGQTALCGLIGMGFSNLYLLWLYRDIDAVTATDYVPMLEARQIEAPIPRILAIWLASYYHALRPRLLVPISLAALMAGYNVMAETPLTGFQEAGLLLGFLSHKMALFLKVADEVAPKGYGEESSRPRIDKFEEEDVKLQLDRWGRPKVDPFTMPTEALPDDVDPQNMGLLPSLLVKAAERVEASEAASAPLPAAREAEGSSKRS